MTWFSSLGTNTQKQSPLKRVWLVTVLLLPSLLLIASVAWVKRPPYPNVMILIGIAIALFGLLQLLRRGTSHVLSSKFLLGFYLVAYAAIRFIEPDLHNAWCNLALSICLLTPVCIFTYREFTATGGNIRRAKFLLQGIISREDWPNELDEIRQISEVSLLRQVLLDNPSPAIAMLHHPNPKIQTVLLVALENFPKWRKDDADAVIQRANSTDEPLVRTAAMLALTNVTKDRHVACLIPFMSDESAMVRRAAAIAVLSDARNRWNDIRSHIRMAISKPYASKDGPLPCSANYPPSAIQDLLMWAGEAGVIGKRATETLLRHCKKSIVDDGCPEAIDRMVKLLLDEKVQPPIRIEIAHRLRNSEHLPPEVATKLLGTNQPTMLRLIAAAAMLSQREDPRAVEALRDAAQQPNRQIGLAAAQTIQKYLGIDMGLPVGEELPHPNSRLAADVTRRVMKWSTGEFGQTAVDTPTEGVHVPGWDD